MVVVTFRQNFKLITAALKAYSCIYWRWNQYRCLFGGRYFNLEWPLAIIFVVIQKPLKVKWKSTMYFVFFRISLNCYHHIKVYMLQCIFSCDSICNAYWLCRYPFLLNRGDSSPWCWLYTYLLPVWVRLKECAASSISWMNLQAIIYFMFFLSIHMSKICFG